MHTFSLILRKPPAAPLEAWIGVLSQFKTPDVIPLNTGIKTTSLLILDPTIDLSDTAQPGEAAKILLLFHIVLHPDTPKEDKDAMFALVQREYDLLSLGLTDPIAALETLLSSP